MELFPELTRDQRADTDGLAERVEGLVTWLQQLDTRVRATELASGDEKTAKELRKAVEALAKHDPKFEDRLTNKVDVLADRVATLAGTVSTTTAALAGKDGEIAALKRELAIATGAVAELQTEARRVTAPAELDELRRAIERVAAERSARGESKKLAALEEKLGLLTQRVDTVSGTVSTAAAGIAGAEGELVGLRRRLEEESARLATTISELRAAVDPVPLHDLRAALEAVSGQVAAQQKETRRDLVALGVDLEAVTHRLGGLDDAVAGIGETVSATSSDLAAARARLQAGDERRASLERELASVAERFDDLGEQVEDVAASLRSETTSLRDRLEAGDERGALLDQALAGLSAQLTGLAERVDALAASSRQAELEVGSELTALASRFGEGCAQVDALVHDLRASIETMPEPTPGLDETLLERVSWLGARVDEVADEVARAAANDSSSEVAEVVDDLVRRLAAAERELPSPDEAQETAARLADLSARIEFVEAGQRAASALPPVAGDGRFRIELRALELRLEHADAAAREGREAVFAQIERLAAEIETRLQRLEAPEPSPVYVEPDPHGRVVPIRSSEA